MASNKDGFDLGDLNSLPATAVSDTWEEHDVLLFFVFQYKGLRMNKTLVRVSEKRKKDGANTVC